MTPLGAAAVKAIRDLYTEAGWVGSAVARSQTKRTKAPRNSVDWSGWTPGNADAAARALGDMLDGEGLSELLDEADVTISSIADTRLAEAGRIIARALERGDNVETLAADLASIMDDPAWAEIVAWTEMRRATSAASLDWYVGNNIDRVEWTTADGSACDLCIENEEAGPVLIDEGFPSGDDAPPAHPNCGCVIVPFIPMGAADMTDDTLDMSVKAAMPTKDDQAAALQALESLPDDPDKPGHIISPWPVCDVDADDYLDAAVWADSKQKKVRIDDLCASTHHLSRENLHWHIVNVGDVRPDKDDNGEVLAGAGPQVVKTNGDRVIVQGHHRLAAAWLMGIRDALVWQIKEK